MLPGGEVNTDLEMCRSLAQGLFLEEFLYFLFVGISVACERPEFGLSVC